MVGVDSAVLQLPKVDVLVARVLGAHRARVAHDCAACVVVTVPPIAGVLAEYFELDFQDASERSTHRSEDGTEVARVAGDRC